MSGVRPQVALRLSLEVGTLSPKLARLSPKPERLSPKPDGLALKPNAPGGLPEPLRAEVAALGQRSPPAAMEAAILALCRWQPHTTEALAQRLGRRRDTVSDYVMRLLRSGRLQATHPEHPRHPQQAYRAVDGGESGA